MSKIVIGQQFCGPPNSGNGGYCCGVLAKDLDGPVTSVLRARVPLDVELGLTREPNGWLMTDADGALVGKGGPSTGAELPDPPPAPSVEAVRAAMGRYIGLEQRVHPTCFTCGPQRDEGDGLRVFAGQIEGAPGGHVAALWTPHANFADDEGLAPTEVVWAAMDCPGFFAWVVKEGRHGALLGTMSGEVTRRPRVGEETIIVAWPLAREGRKETAGVALYSTDGELMARAHQVWIVMSPPAQPQPAAAATASA